MRHGLRRLLGAGFLLLLAGCAALPPQEEAPIKAADGGFLLTGKLSVVYDGQGFFGNLRWRHGPDYDDMMLLTPLGQGVAQLVRDGGGVTLTTSERKTYRAPDAETLTEEVLGWRLPLAGLPYWVRGLPAPGSYERENGGLRQNGWLIEWERRAEGVPALTLMRRDNLEVKLAVDSWQGAAP